jgi:hypothetical protein
VGCAKGGVRGLDTRCLRCVKGIRERFNAVRLSCNSSPSSLDRQEFQMHPTTSGAITADDAQTKIRVGAFDIVKQNNNSAMKNIVVLFIARGGGVDSVSMS